MRGILAGLLAALALPALALADPNVVPGMSGGPSYGANVYTGAQTAPSFVGSLVAAPLYYAQAYGSCVWDGASGHDIGPCVNSAIAAASAAAGGTVIIPAGAFYYATQIQNNTSGVHLVGAGVGIPRDTTTPGHYLAASRLIWNGAAGATATLIAPAAGAATQQLYSVDVTGIVFDGNNSANVSIEIEQAAYSTFSFGCAEAVKTCAWLTTLPSGGEAPGFQNNDVWIWARDVGASNNSTATGILIDGQPSWAAGLQNVSFNRFHILDASYAAGDGIVVGFSDTNQFFRLQAYHFGSSTTGSPIVFAAGASAAAPNAPNYVPPSGVAVHGYPDGNVVLSTSAAIQFQGGTTASTWTPNPGNTGTAALNPVTLTTTAALAAGSQTLTFASNAGILLNEAASCGGSSCGIYSGTQVRTLPANQAQLYLPAVSSGGVSGVANGQAVKFSYSVADLAIAGSYMIQATAADNAHWNVLPPAVGSAAVSAVGSAYAANTSGTMTWSGASCPINPILNVTTNGSGQIASAAVATAGNCTVVPGTATTWTASGGLGAGSGASFAITAAGGTIQTGVSVSGGLLSVKDVTIPLTGTPAANDFFTLNIPQAAIRNSVLFIDKDNSISDPFFEPPASGYFTSPYSPFPTVAGGPGITCAAIGGGSIQHSGTTPNVINTGAGASPGAIVCAPAGGNSVNASTNGYLFGGINNFLTNTFGGGIVGGNSNILSGVYGHISGGQFASDRGRYNSRPWASGEFSAFGDAQTSESLIRGSTTSTSAARLTADGLTAGSANCINIPNNTAYSIRVTITALDHTNVGNNEIWANWSGLLTRGASAAATSLTMAATPTPISNGTVTGSAIAASADTTNGCLNLSFTPPAGNSDTWRAVAHVNSVEVQ